MRICPLNLWEIFSLRRIFRVALQVQCPQRLLVYIYICVCSGRLSLWVRSSSFVAIYREPAPRPADNSTYYTRFLSFGQPRDQPGERGWVVSRYTIRLQELSNDEYNQSIDRKK